MGGQNRFVFQEKVCASPDQTRRWDQRSRGEMSTQHFLSFTNGGEFRKGGVVERHFLTRER